MESDAAVAVRFREGTTTATGAAAASSSSTPRGRASLIVRGMARRGGSLRRSLKHLTIGGGGGGGGGGSGARDANSGRGCKSEGFSSGKERLEENAETVEKVRRNGVSDDDNENDDGKAKSSTWSQRYSAWRRSLRGKAGKNAEPPPPPPPPDDAVVPKTCCAFSRR